MRHDPLRSSFVPAWTLHTNRVIGARFRGKVAKSLAKVPQEMSKNIHALLALDRERGSVLLQ